MKFLAGIAGFGLAAVATAAQAQVVSETNSEAWHLVRAGGQVVASTSSTVFIRGSDGRVFECDFADGTKALNERFGGRIKFSGLPLKLISTCNALGEDR